jgi:hypothetical protein
MGDVLGKSGRVTQILKRKDAGHSRSCFGRTGVDPLDSRLGVNAPHDKSVKHPRGSKVVNENSPST